jgi:hypothetical protein
VSDRTYAPDAASTIVPRTGLREEPNLEMQLAARWSDGICSGCDTAIQVPPGHAVFCSRCARNNDHPNPPAGAALFPEVVTWTDQQLITAIELADRREPALRLGATGNVPDRHEVLLNACSAELVRRVEEQGVRMAA